MHALAKLPTKANPADAGIDLYTTKKEVVPSNSIRTFSTGLAMEIPKGWFGFILERSGFSTSNTLKLKAGVVDPDYRGEIKIVMQNCGDYPITVDVGTKIAQMVFLPVPIIDIEEVSELSETERGDKGFGSSDVTV